MKRNAWKVCEEVISRVDDAPGPGCNDYMKAYVTPSKEEMFFWDKNYLMEYVHKSKGQKAQAPGHGYYAKLDEFIQRHFKIGELFMEFVKNNCENAECEFCAKGWSGSELQNGPFPFPDHDRLPNFHYKPMAETPRCIDDNPRDTDDFQPRAQMKKMVKADTLSSGDAESIKQFSTKYIISEKLVREYVLHVETLQLTQSKRKCLREKKKVSKQNSPYEDYDWVDLYRNGKLGKLYAVELNKYLVHHAMDDKVSLPKKDKLSWVEAHIGKELFKELGEDEESSDEDTIAEYSSESDDDEDQVVAQINEIVLPEQDQLINPENNDSEVLPNVITRRGRLSKRSSYYADYVT
ncbi:MAG: hypothetical protein GY705_02310 [Bacteroidetes bacterium]|nr:hypothetical protein [Bacteroidota bacterium]